MSNIKFGRHKIFSRDSISTIKVLKQISTTDFRKVISYCMNSLKAMFGKSFEITLGNKDTSNEFHLISQAYK